MFKLRINLQEPCVLYTGRAYRYPTDVAFYIFFSTNISTEYFKHAAHSPFFSSKCRFFHNATFFGYCIIHNLHIDVLKLNIKIRCQTIKVYSVEITFMGPYIANIFQYMSTKMQIYTVDLYLETTLHVSGVTSTHHQDSIQLYLQHLIFVTLLLLSAAIAAGSSNSVI
jgi:hypothetical protein